MTTYDCIKARRSFRTFDGRNLSDNTSKKLIEFAESTDNPFNIPVTWKILDAEKYGLSSPVITGCKTYIAGVIKHIPHAEEAFGYSFEKVVLFAQSLGIGTTWIAGTMNRTAFEKAVQLKPGEVLPCVSPIGYPAKKMSVREIMMRKGVKADKRLDFSELFYEGSFSRPLSIDKSGKLKNILEGVRLSPSAVNKQPWRIVLCEDKAHFFEKHSKGYISNDGWDLQKIDIGIALCHFSLMAEEQGLKIEFSTEKPDIQTENDTEYISTYIIK